MPCCAAAAFIIAQVMLGVDALRRFFFGSGSAAVAGNPATEWRLDAPALALPKSSRILTPRRIAIAAVIEIVILAGGGYELHAHFSGHHHHHAVATLNR